MIPPHSKDFGFARGYSLQRGKTISCNRGLEKREVEVVKSHDTWQNEPSYTLQDGFQQKTSRNGLHRTVCSNPSNLPRTSPMENGRQEIKARFPLQRTCRKYSEDFPQRDILQRTYYRREMEPEIRYFDPLRLMRTGNPTRLPSGFKPLRRQKISDQELPYFTVQDRIQERKRIIGKEQDFFQREAERVRAYYPGIFGPVARSTKKQQTVSTISSNTLWLKSAKFVEQTQKEFERLHESISRLQEVYTLQTKTIHTLQEDYTELYKASEDTKRRLNQVLEEQNNCKRDREYLDQDIDKLFNYCQKMKLQTQGHVSGNTPYHPEDIKPDDLLEKKPRSLSQYQDGDKMTYSEKEALKQLSEASSWPKLSGIGEYDHMEINYYIDGLFTDVPSIPDYWITARSNTAFKGHARIWYTEMKEIHGRRNWPWWRSQIIQNYRNDTLIWQKALSFGNYRYTVDKDPYDWFLRQSKRLIAIDPHITTERRNYKLLTKLLGDLEHAVKCRCSKESTLHEISNTLQEVRIRTSIGRYNNHSTGDNRENPTLEANKTNDSDSEITTRFHNLESLNPYADNSPKDRGEMFSREEETTEDQEGHESDSDSVGNGCGNNSYSEPNPHEEYLVEFKNHGIEEIGSVHSQRRKPMTKHLDGLKHKPPDREGMTTRKLLAQGQMNHANTSKKRGKSHQ
ncbi:hypothetical protein O181_093274 [Austropuccinia psidii MF-1]|uniref:Uncharacterized protein n=1 Tax=Austropuccinia psidii MF-1 TaxID=1389203 RepID=A0A9Q3J0W6_9BASI|nr:hypothetical protein [Austropuccinia psidii MF-1]